MSGLVSSLVPSDSLEEMASFCWKLSKLLLIFSIDISSSKILSLFCKFLMWCLIWLISCCKSWRVTSFCLFLNLSKVFVKLMIGLSCSSLVSLLINNDFNMSVYFCFNSVSSNLLINSIRAISSWCCLVRTMVCLIGLQQVSLHPNSILLWEVSLGEW